ncbi:S-layer homology domain-containing protein [Falsibacillus pallidus]|uniref:S-layer family protein n=1 Tax=Falsibacillus pallidus TaxID=493781 RepID=A0A370GIC4_9BACI|nr:S-layer homology domain-containing protein [Falsibacillus pallidus]RDI41673.1 S-layer family protein [Falsibacillus pallidus]
MKKQTIAGLVVGAALLASPVLPSQGYASSSSFTDIENSYAKDAIISLQQAGIINGFGNGKFNPTGNLTREEFAKVLVLANGLDTSNPPKQGTFSDVTTSSWAYSYVEAAVKAGYINGYTDGTFKGGTNLSREQMAVMFVRSLDVDVTGYGSKLTFTDNGSISNSYKDAIAFSVEAGLISGQKDGKFDPKGNATREQVAKVASSFIKVKEDIKKPAPAPEPDPIPTPTPVRNHAPASSLIEAKSITVNHQHVNILDAFSVFTDRDGDALTFSATSSNIDVATVALEGNDLYVSGLAAGISTITLTANDHRGGTATASFVLTVSLTPQELAIKKIEDVTTDANGITLTDINTAINGESALVENMEIYRKAFIDAADTDLNSAEKINTIINSINKMFTLISSGVTATTVDHLSYHVYIDGNHLDSEEVKNTWATAIFTYHSEGTSASIYEDMKGAPALDPELGYFHSKSSSGLTDFTGAGLDASNDIVILFLDEDKNVIGYAPLSENAVRPPSTNSKIELKNDQEVISSFSELGDDAYEISISKNTSVNNLLASFTAEDNSHQIYEVFDELFDSYQDDNNIISKGSVLSVTAESGEVSYYFINLVPEINPAWNAPSFTKDVDAPLSLSGLFTDEDNDDLTYSIEALDKDIADISAGEGTSLPTIHPISGGTAHFTVKASDGRGGTKEATISVTIEAPVIPTFFVTSIDFKNGTGVAGQFDDNDELVITFSKEVNPATINASLTKGGEIAPGSSFYLKADQISDTLWFVDQQQPSSYHIGTFNVVDVVIGGYGADGSIRKITLDPTGKILTFQFYNILHDPYADASDSTYIEFTPDPQIKDINGESIATSIKVREANGSKHY